MIELNSNSIIISAASTLSDTKRVPFVNQLIVKCCHVQIQYALPSFIFKRSLTLNRTFQFSHRSHLLQLYSVITNMGKQPLLQYTCESILSQSHHNIHSKDPYCIHSNIIHVLLNIPPLYPLGQILCFIIFHIIALQLAITLFLMYFLTAQCSEFSHGFYQLHHFHAICNR